MNIKLIAIDLDDTLLNEERKVNKEVKDAVQAAKKAGIQVVICTGRPFPGVISLTEELELNAPDDYVISYNGALVQNAGTHEEVVNYTMNHDDYLTLEKAAAEAEAHFHAIHNEGIFTPNKDISQYSVREAFLIGLPLFYRTPDEMDPSASYSKMMMVDDETVLEAAISRLPEELWEDYTVLRSKPFFLEFLNRKASKGNAVKALAERLDISQENVMAIGDSGNDIDMITFAGLGVAMGNATEELKEAADFITYTNGENGVARAIYKYVLTESC